MSSSADMETSPFFLRLMTRIIAPLRPVTRRFPSLIRYPLATLVGDHCYDVLVKELRADDVRCFKHALSKSLGLGVVCGGAVAKVPQIVKIIRAHSTRGISFSAYVLDSVGLAATCSYSSRMAFPFGTYGEGVFVLLQNFFIMYFILAWGTSPRRRANVAMYITVNIVSFVALLTVPLGMSAALAALSVPFSLLSKIPQMISNYKLKTTGEQSAFLLYSSLAGNVARVYTTSVEVHDQILWWNFVGVSLFTAVLVLQMIYYDGVRGTAPRPRRVLHTRLVSSELPIFKTQIKDT